MIVAPKRPRDDKDRLSTLKARPVHASAVDWNSNKQGEQADSHYKRPFGALGSRHNA